MELSGVSTYTGSTNIMGGTLLLRDSGSIAGTSGINVNYATLTYDNSGLADQQQPAAHGRRPGHLTGGTFTTWPARAPTPRRWARSTLTGGANTITSTLWASTTNYGSSVVLTAAQPDTRAITARSTSPSTGGTLGGQVSAVAGISPLNGAVQHPIDLQHYRSGD